MSFTQIVLLAALEGLATLLLPSIAEGQLQAAWKFSKEGSIDNQAFVSINGHSANLPPVLGQLFGGGSSIGDFLGLVQVAQAERVGEAIDNGTAADPLLISLFADNSTVLAPPQVQDDRPVPESVDVGVDGGLYFLSNVTFDTLSGCQNYCHGFRGFQLAIAKTNLTMSQMKKYGAIQINMAIQRKPDGIKYVWGDGTELDKSLLLPNEPVMNNRNSDRMAIFAHGSDMFLDDSVCCYGSHFLKCLCQGILAPLVDDKGRNQSDSS